MITPVTPAATTRSRSARSSTVQASTGTPADRAAATARGVTSVWFSMSAVAPARRTIPLTRGGTEARRAESPSLTSGQKTGRRETPNLSSG